MPIKSSKYQSLPTQDLANLYLQFSRLEESGIPIQETIRLLIGNHEMGQRAKRALNYLKQGKPLSEAGRLSGLFVGLDAVLIKVAETSGTQTKIFRQLAQFYEEKTQQIRQIRSHLFLPLTILLLALFIQPLPALVSQQISFLGYFWAVISVFIPIALLAFIARRLPHWIRYSFLRPFVKLWDQMELKTPYFGRWFVSRYLRNFTQSLGLMLQAGLPILEALPKAYDVVENALLRQQLQKMTSNLQRGDSLGEAFSQIEGINPIAHHFVSTGDHAGRLAEMLLHYARLESETIAFQNQQIALWVPRIIYVCVALWMSYSIFTGFRSHLFLADRI